VCVCVLVDIARKPAPPTHAHTYKHTYKADTRYPSPHIDTHSHPVAAQYPQGERETHRHTHMIHIHTAVTRGNHSNPLPPKFVRNSNLNPTH